MRGKIAQVGLSKHWLLLLPCSRFAHCSHLCQTLTLSLVGQGSFAIEMVMAFWKFRIRASAPCAKRLTLKQWLDGQKWSPEKDKLCTRVNIYVN